MGSDANVTRMLLSGEVTHKAGQQFLAGKGMAGERFPRVHRVEAHGFTSHPVEGGIATVVQARSNRDSVYAMGGANPSLVPELGAGGSAIYDHLGNIVSVVENVIRIKAAEGIYLEAPVIVLTGTVKLGGEDAERPASARDTVDSLGGKDVANLATMVFLK